MKRSLHRVELGGLDVHIPVVDTHPGQSPRLAIVAGLHGDEHAPFWVAQRLLEGTLAVPTRLVLGANLPALWAGQRLGPMDRVDQNRIAHLNGTGLPTVRLAEVVAALVEPAELSVHLHNFELEAPLVAIEPPGLSAERQRRHDGYLRALQPAVVWQVGGSAPDRFAWETSFDRLCEARGVDVLAVEMGPLSGDLQGARAAVRGLRALAASLAGQGTGPSTPLLRGPRHLLRSPDWGLFEPDAPVGARLQTGDLVGALCPPGGGEVHPVVATVGGLLMQRSGPALLSPGQILGALVAV